MIYIRIEFQSIYYIIILQKSTVIVCTRRDVLNEIKGKND